MGVYIPKMDMPTRCEKCDLAYDDDGYFACPFTKAFYKSKQRPTWCPLIELPPHGDLIDRDALMKDGWLSLHKEVMRMGGYAIHELPLINPSIPVVIEKENC